MAQKQDVARRVVKEAIGGCNCRPRSRPDRCRCDAILNEQIKVLAFGALAELMEMSAAEIMQSYSIAFKVTRSKVQPGAGKRTSGKDDADCKLFERQSSDKRAMMAKMQATLLAI